MRLLLRRQLVRITIMEEQNFGFLDLKIDFMALMDVLLNICQIKGTLVFTFLSLLLA